MQSQQNQDAVEAVRVARQAAGILLLTSAVTLTSLFSDGTSAYAVVVVSGLELSAGLAVSRATQFRGGTRSVVALAVTATLFLSCTTWVSNGFVSGVGPLFVLLFTWIGLHQSVRVVVSLVPLAAVGHLCALLAIDARPRLLASTLVLLPIAAVVGVLIARSGERRREAERQLRSKDQWRAALIAALAHDIRSPLSSILGALEILEDDAGLDERHLSLLRSATRQGNRILRLAVEILEVERVEEGSLRLDVRSVDLFEVASEVAALTESSDVRVDVARGTRVHVDRERIEQILYNLVNNALRHGKGPVVVSVRLGAMSASLVSYAVELRVRDHGDGVPAGDVSTLFDRFSTATRSSKSVGLGLWIVRLLVEAHGGTIRYEDADPGASFVVTIPQASSTAVTAASPD